ncbi:DUF2281 domain-containing protein [Gracilimonas mengyeensis]|uniref:DUF2281 domain-containing protein n=1 Tax=Gracilimonas mengyeensis TaxID=1302730 RepID=A0A521EFZ2_9BACT|nr:DUF2281 domain-containing protein [Gracilimonas mengyeensis]SMO82856.1 hypothetical protein SAMN06265219_1123 [Gracilimonas mengyeensis]
MSNKELLLREIEELPDDKLRTVINFVRELKSRNSQESLGITFVSEPSLEKDWNKPEEDEAWSDL